MDNWEQFFNVAVYRTNAPCTSLQLVEKALLSKKGDLLPAWNFFTPDPLTLFVKSAPCGRYILRKAVGEETAQGTHTVIFSAQNGLYKAHPSTEWVALHHTNAPEQLLRSA